MKLKQLNILLTFILLIGLTCWPVGRELQLNIENQLSPKQIAQPSINGQLPIIRTKIEQIESSHALPSEIKVGGVFPIVTRPDAGPDRRDAFLIAIYEINNQTGADRILPEGVSLKPIVKDDDNSVAGGTLAAQELIAAGVDIVIGSSGSHVSAAISTELTPHKIPQISYASSSSTLSNRTLYPYFMRVEPSDADQSEALVDLVTAFNWTKGATIFADNVYEASFNQNFIKIFESRNGTVLTSQSFSPGALDVASNITTIKTAAPEFVLGSFNDVDAATVMKEAKVQGIDTLPWIMTAGWSTTTTFSGDDNVKDAMQKAVGTMGTLFTGTAYSAFNATWFDTAWDWLEGPAYSQSMGTSFNPYAPFAYDAVYVAAKGLANAGTVDGDSLLTALYDVTLEGASGYIEFNDLGEVSGRYDYVQLIDQTFKSFGGWDGTPTYETGTFTLHDGSNWLILNDMFIYLYIISGPISITSNADFGVAKYDFPGYGNATHPWLIQGWNITENSGTLISISGTTDHFCIRYNLLDGETTATSGISLNNVVNGTIANNIVVNNTQGGIVVSLSNDCAIFNNSAYDNNMEGINVDSSSDISITDNTVYNNSIGIYIKISDNINITSNFVYNNQQGIELWGSDSNTIFNNSLYSNENYGLAIGGAPGSHYNTISNNTIHDNNGDGIGVGGNYNKFFYNTIYRNEDGIQPALSNFTTISNNNIYDNNGNGIFLTVSSNNNTITQNHVHKHKYVGITIWENSDNNTITNNTVYGNSEHGISVGINGGSKNNNISYNTVYYNSWTGISLQYSDNNIIERNIVYGNNANGISFSNSNNNKISSNTVNNNSPRGIPITNSKSNIFSNNVIFENAEWGISFESGADDNIVQFNDFSRNSGGNPPQILDQGINNTFSSNYWSDWTETGSYAIAGEAMNQDLSPLTNPYHLSAPVITAPTSATPTLKDSVTIQWTASSDVFGHSLTYAVFYSIDNEVTWIKIKSGMFTTNYLWDLTSIYDGTTVRIKVQTTDKIGFNSFSVSKQTFTIENPSLIRPTTTTTTTALTSTTTLVPTVGTPSWTVLVPLLSLIAILALRQRKKKA